MYQKVTKKILGKNNFIVVFTNKFRVFNPHATWGTTGGDVCISSVMCCATCKEEPGVAGSTLMESEVQDDGEM